MTLPVQIIVIIASVLVGLYLLIGIGDFVLCFIRNKAIKAKLVKIYLPSWILDQNPISYEIKAKDNITLRAKYIPHKSAKRIFIMVHGFTGNMYKDFEEIAYNVFDKYQASLLLVSLRCHDESDGHIITFGYKEHEDVILWAKFASENISSSLPIYLWGTSMGAYSVLASTRFEFPKNVKGVIADSAYTKGYEEVKCIAKKLYKFVGTIFMPIMCLCAKICGFSLSKYDNRKILNNTKLPILFVHGTDDQIVPIHMAEENFEAKKDGYKDLLIVKEAPHIRAFQTDKVTYCQHLDKLFKVCE